MLPPPTPKWPPSKTAVRTQCKRKLSRRRATRLAPRRANLFVALTLRRHLENVCRHTGEDAAAATIILLASLLNSSQLGSSPSGRPGFVDWAAAIYCCLRGDSDDGLARCARNKCMIRFNYVAAVAATSQGGRSVFKASCNLLGALLLCRKVVRSAPRSARSVTRFFRFD